MHSILHKPCRAESVLCTPASPPYLLLLKVGLARGVLLLGFAAAVHLPGPSSPRGAGAQGWRRGRARPLLPSPRGGLRGWSRAAQRRAESGGDLREAGRARESGRGRGGGGEAAGAVRTRAAEGAQLAGSGQRGRTQRAFSRLSPSSPPLPALPSSLRPPWTCAASRSPEGRGSGRRSPPREEGRGAERSTPVLGWVGRGGSPGSGGRRDGRRKGLDRPLSLQPLGPRRPGRLAVVGGLRRGLGRGGQAFCGGAWTGARYFCLLAFHDGCAPKPTLLGSTRQDSVLPGPKSDGHVGQPTTEPRFCRRPLATPLRVPESSEASPAPPQPRPLSLSRLPAAPVQTRTAGTRLFWNRFVYFTLRGAPSWNTKLRPVYLFHSATT